MVAHVEIDSLGTGKIPVDVADIFVSVYIVFRWFPVW